MLIPVPRPTVTPAFIILLTSHIPDSKLVFDAGQCATEVPVSLNIFNS